MKQDEGPRLDSARSAVLSAEDDDEEPAPYSEQHVKRRLSQIKKQASSLPRPPRPTFTPLEPGIDVTAAMRRVQTYITSLEYNFTGSNHFERRRDRGMLYLSAVVGAIMRDCLPIQCVEAVFLAAVLTAGLHEVDRLPLSFKSQTDGKVFRHIVLAIHHKGRWGALGLSRRPNLMDKEIKFSSLSELVWEYEKAYRTCWHRLTGVYLGFPLPHDPRSIMPIKWRALHLNLPDDGPAPCPHATRVLDNYARSTGWLMDYFHRTASLPDGLHDMLRQPGEYPRRLNSLVKRRASSRLHPIHGGVPPLLSSPTAKTEDDALGGKGDEDVLPGDTTSATTRGTARQIVLARPQRQHAFVGNV